MPTPMATPARFTRDMSTEATPHSPSATSSSNEALFARAQRVIPGGVNSPVRAFRAVGGQPRFIDRAQGAYMWDVEGRRYIDYIGSWGPMILGHGHPQVLDAVARAASQGLSFGAPTLREVELAEAILAHVQGAQQVRLVNSGTEAAMSAMRLARGHTGRNQIVKFEGCYHGHADALLVKAGSGLATFGQATSAGVPQAVVQDTLVLPFNDVNALEQAFAEHGQTIACVMLEAIAGNMNFVRAQLPFLRRLRELCTAHSALLILDEVMTGFRVGPRGAQGVYAAQWSDFQADLTVLGKVIGGGMPLAAFAGPSHIMQSLAPSGPVYQAGTLSGNPVATACGLKTLELIAQPGFYTALAQRTRALSDGLAQAARQAGVPWCSDSEGGMFGFFLTNTQPQNYRQVMALDAALFGRFFHLMLEQGVYLAPALYEAGFVSAAHSDEDIAATVAAAELAFRQL